jgi:hypothetical protein
LAQLARELSGNFHSATNTTPPPPQQQQQQQQPRRPTASAVFANVKVNEPPSDYSTPPRLPPPTTANKTTALPLLDLLPSVSAGQGPRTALSRDSDMARSFQGSPVGNGLLPIQSPRALKATLSHGSMTQPRTAYL